MVEREPRNGIEDRKLDVFIRLRRESNVAGHIGFHVMHGPCGHIHLSQLRGFERDYLMKTSSRQADIRLMSYSQVHIPRGSRKGLTFRVAAFSKMIL
jgi:hypothetical protein